VPFSVSEDQPDEPARDAVRRLADRIEAEDGAPPLSDQARGQLGSPGVRHVVVRAGAEIVGYAQAADDVLEVAAEVAAVDATLDAAAGTATHAWTHGRRSRLAAAFERRGFIRMRELYQLRRPLDDDHPLPADPPLPDGVRVRAFVPGRDDDAWLALNAASFAAHAEQGRWTHAELAARMAEPWFDPAGFLLADRDATLLGFHWTKVHPDGAGEVYVLGVAPAAQGLGLGQALLVRGLRLLAARGCPVVLLYVDGDNPTAIRLYQRAGFTEHDLDVQWALPAG
jgi:mycothiol synthase